AEIRIPALVANVYRHWAKRIPSRRSSTTMARHAVAVMTWTLLGLVATETGHAEAAPDTVRLDRRFADVTPDTKHPFYLGPAFVVLKDGSVMTFYHAPVTYDSPPGATWIASRISRDEGKTWTPEQKIVQQPECQVSHPTALRDRDGIIHVFYLGYKKHSWSNGEPNPDDQSDLWTVQSL